MELRHPSDWIEIPNVTPPIVDVDTFNAVQALLDDPERRRRGKRRYSYPLTGRLQCNKCDRAMVGQTLKGMYRYYRCRRAFSGPRHDRCDSRYVRASDLEHAVRETAGQILSNPKMLITEYEKMQSAVQTEHNVVDLRKQIDKLDAQNLRLIKLFQMGDIDDQYYVSESRALKRQRAMVESKIVQIKPNSSGISKGQVEEMCRRVREWVVNSSGADYDLLVEALQINIKAEKGRGELIGVIPDYAQGDNHAHVHQLVS